jgi:adenine-specific DNA-methyltransferase
VPIGPYIADFACLAEKLIVEIDGGQHLDQRDYDERRTRFLEGRGYRVIRFWNLDVITNPEGVIETIAAALAHPSPDSLRSPPSPRSAGRGGARRASAGR